MTYTVWRASLVAQLVKNPPAMQETLVQFLGQEDPLEDTQEDTHSSILGLLCGSLDSSLVKNPPANAGDVGSIPGSGRSPGVENGNPLQYSCLENPMGWGVWCATVYGDARVRHDLATTTTNSNNKNEILFWGEERICLFPRAATNWVASSGNLF